MSQFLQHTKTVSIAASADLRVWANPFCSPVKNLTIILSGSFSTTLLDQEVLLGGYFVNGSGAVVPYFSPDAVSHAGGESQAAAAAVGGNPQEVYKNTGVLPGNSISDDIKIPVAIELTNGDTKVAVVSVTFLAETLGTTV